MKRGWEFLKQPTARDIAPRNRQRGLSQAPVEYDYLVVCDLEWTVNHKSPPEVIEFGLVLLPLKGVKRPLSVKDIQTANCTEEIQLYCKPTEKPLLSQFIKDLTGISQETVDAAPTFDIQFKALKSWLITHKLIDSTGVKTCNWAICTWSDADVQVIKNEVERKEVGEFPEALNAWINLKDDSYFKKVYRRPPRQGLENCCNTIAKVGFVGGAHSGIVDARNTAAICVDMVNKGFRFVRTSRGFDKHGHMYGRQTFKKT